MNEYILTLPEIQVREEVQERTCVYWYSIWVGVGAGINGHRIRKGEQKVEAKVIEIELEFDHMPNRAGSELL